MLNINFVPEDYIQNNESCRTNLLYLVIFVVLMAGLSGVFFTIKLRQRAVNSKEAMVNNRMTKAQKAISQFEKLQVKRKLMMKTALTTAELIEPVPRSVVLAALTNNLPPGTSLLQLSLIQKEPRNSSAYQRKKTKYQAAKTGDKGKNTSTISKEKLLKTYIEVEGVAPSDLQVAKYIELLDGSNLLDDVALVESKEFVDKKTLKSQEEESGIKLRQFKLTAMLKKDVHLNKKDVERIKNAYEKSKYVF